MKLRPVRRSPILRAWGPGEEDVDLFAGGGGASEGKRRATGRSPDVAVNHWPTAIAVHAANHPDCTHYIEDVYKVTPIEATKGKRVRLLWASPTCIHFSRAKGTRLSPDTIKIRGLAWSIVPWIVQCRPEYILLENVPEFEGWGPICHQHADGCAGAHDESGKSCDARCLYGRPIKNRIGETFRAWVARIKSFSYSVEWRKLRAWEYGAPTTRERLYVIMRADGGAITWPEPTHARPEDAQRLGRKPWRTACEIIDWSIRCPSIFERKRPLVAATRRRVARGLRKFVLEAKRPFLLHVTHGDRHAPHDILDPMPTVTGAHRGEQAVVQPYVLPVKTWGGGGNEARSADEPMRTVTASKRGEFAVASPYMIHRSNGERQGQDPRTYDVKAPHPTVVAGGIKTAPVVAFVAKHYSERHDGEVQASDLGQPLGSITAKDHNALVAASLVKFRGTSPAHPGSADAAEPTPTISAGGTHVGVQAAYLARYNGERRDGEDARGSELGEPASTLDAANRLAITSAFLSRYNGKSTGSPADAPASTIDARDRLALIEAQAAADAETWTPAIATKAHRVYEFLVAEGVEGPWLDHGERIVRIPGTELVVYDIGMRMLVPRELFRAQGFTDDYIIELTVGPKGKPVSKTEQVRLAGNSVCPDVAEALIRATLGTITPLRPKRAPEYRVQLDLFARAA